MKEEDLNVDFEEIFNKFYDDDETIPIDIDSLQANKNITIDLTTEQQEQQQQQQQHLSQKFNQLSASTNEETNENQSKESVMNEQKRPSLTPTTPVAITKKLKIDMMEMSVDPDPSTTIFINYK